MTVEHAEKKRAKQVRGLQDIHDLSVLMLNQGCRPEELRELPQSWVDLEHGLLTIQCGKSAASRRVLPMTAATRDVLVRRLQAQTRGCPRHRNTRRGTSGRHSG